MKELNKLQIKLETMQDTETTIYCCVEELSEVTKVLMKFLRKSPKFSLDDLTEELSHALLMLNVVKNRFYISDEDIENNQLLALRKCFK